MLERQGIHCLTGREDYKNRTHALMQISFVVFAINPEFTPVMETSFPLCLTVLIPLCFHTSVVENFLMFVTCATILPQISTVSATPSPYPGSRWGEDKIILGHLRSSKGECTRHEVHHPGQGSFHNTSS